MKNIFTVDVEEFHHRICYRKYFSQKKINKNYNSSLIGTRKIMEILEEYNVKGTFFILGDTARHNPELVKEIDERGHELASHGFSHRQLTELNPEGFLRELNLTEKIIRDITGRKIVGFRAPKFSLTKKTSWAIDILKDKNYIYDSSIFPSTLIYGKVESPFSPYRISSKSIDKNSNKGLYEFPLLTYPFGRINIPIKLRHIGLSITCSAIRKTNELGFPATFLVHPWEFLPTNFEERLNLPRTISTFVREFGIPSSNHLRAILDNFEFCTIREYINQNHGMCY